MSAPHGGPEIAKRRWYALAQRHRRMAFRLLRSNFLDGAVFHAYHAFECVISAVIAAQGYPVPPSHKGRFALFDRVADLSRSFGTSYLRLSTFTVQTRNDALYYDEVRALLPAERFSQEFVENLLPLVDQFAREVWKEIR